MDIQYSVIQPVQGIEKKNQEPSFRTFYNIVYNVRSVYKMFVFVPMLNEHPTFGDDRNGVARVIAADDIPQNIMS